MTFAIDRLVYGNCTDRNILDNFLQVSSKNGWTVKVATKEIQIILRLFLVCHLVWPNAIIVGNV